MLCVKFLETLFNYTRPPCKGTKYVSWKEHYLVAFQQPLQYGREMESVDRYVHRNHEHNIKATSPVKKNVTLSLVLFVSVYPNSACVRACVRNLSDPGHGPGHILHIMTRHPIPFKTNMAYLLSCLVTFCLFYQYIHYISTCCAD